MQKALFLGAAALLASAPLAAQAALPVHTVGFSQVQQFTAQTMITKKQAIAAARKAIGGGGTVTQVQLEREPRITFWSVDLVKGAYEYEVHVDAYSGRILHILRRPAN